MTHKSATTPRTDSLFGTGPRTELAETAIEFARTLERELRELRAERDALAKDAERYRWLRTSDQNRDAIFSGLACQYYNGEELDAAIDAALAAQDKP